MTPPLNTWPDANFHPRAKPGMKQWLAWRQLPTDEGAVSMTRPLYWMAQPSSPMITFGTNPGMGMPISGKVPDPAASRESMPARRSALFEKALVYMGSPQPGQPALGAKSGCGLYWFSCTNSRIQ